MDGLVFLYYRQFRRGWIEALLRRRARSIPLVIFDEVLDHVLRIDRISCQAQSHLSIRMLGKPFSRTRYSYGLY